MFKKIKNIFTLISLVLLFASCNNLFEAQIERKEEQKAEVKTETVTKVNADKDEYYVTLSLQEATGRTVLPGYTYEDCLFNLYANAGESSEVLLMSKVSYNELTSYRKVKVRSGTWTFTVDCYDENDKKILSGTSQSINISRYSTTIQIPMTFITGNDGSIEVSLTFPKGTGIATVKNVRAGLFNSPLAAADSSCSDLTMTSDGDNYKVIFAKSNLESGLTKYVKFFIYSESGVELGRYTEAVILGDNLISKKDLSLTSLRAPNVLTLTLKTNGSTYTGEAKDSLVLKAFPNEEKSYPMTLNEGTTDTYSANIVNGIKYILYDGEYNTKLIYIPTATATSDGIVEYCDSFANATDALTKDAVTTAGLGLIIKDDVTTYLDKDDYNEDGAFNRAVRTRKNEKISMNLEECTKITGIPWYVIDGWSMLVSLSYPKNSEGISEINNPCLVSLFVNEGNKEIHFDYTWMDTIQLEYLYLPASMEKLTCSALGSCVKLKTIVIPEANQYYMSDGERIMSKDGKTLLSWPSAIGAVEIPEGISAIDSGTFCNNKRITDISLPSTLEKIGNQVFSGCTTLRNVQIPKGVTAIGDSAFSSCSNIKNFVIPDSVTSIGNSAFSNCTNLKSITIPDSVNSIGYAAFFECQNLESIKIPSSVKKLGQVDGNSMDHWNGVFARCTSLKTVVLPEELEEIGGYVFYDCYNLKTIDIPDSVTKIWEGAFGWSGLTSVVIPSKVEYIGEYAFSGTKVPSLVIPDSVKYIASGAFQRVKSDSITLPKSLESIESYLFKEAEIGNLIIPDSVKTIGYESFRESKIESIVIPDNVESIGESAFSGASIKTVTFPASVTSIGKYAFSNLNLTSLVIPDTVITIGDFAFYNCKTLETVTIGSGVNSIGKNPFRQCKSISSVNISSDNPYYMSENNSIFSKDKKKLVYWHLNGATEIIIPDTVEEICDYCFADMNAVTKVDLPSKLSIISNYAFYNMELLSELKLPSTMTSIGEYAFYNCNKIKSLEFPDNITNIGDYAFCKCSSVETVKLPVKLTRLNEYCFAYNSFKTIIIPNSVGYVEEEPFYQSKVETVCFKEGRYSIESHWRAFKAPYLTKVYLPKSLGYIRWDSFECAEYITDVYYAGSESDWSNIRIDSSNDYLLNATRHYGETYQDNQD